MPYCMVGKDDRLAHREASRSLGFVGPVPCPGVLAEGTRVNRYEALNALGLEEGAGEQDVRLAYYGLQKAVATQDFSDKDKLAARVEAQLARAKECRDFLLENGTGAAGKAGRSGGVAARVLGGRKRAPQKLEITAERDKQARLAGLERLRINLLTYRDHEASHRLTCLVAILLCVVVGFIAFRYVRVLAPRAMLLVAVCVAAIASSTGFTSAHLQCRAARRHLLDIDERIHALRVELGIEEPADAAAQDGSAGPGGASSAAGSSGVAYAAGPSRGDAEEGARGSVRDEDLELPDVGEK